MVADELAVTVVVQGYGAVLCQQGRHRRIEHMRADCQRLVKRVIVGFLPPRYIGVTCHEGRSRCVVATGRRFAGAGKAGMGGRVGRDRTGPAIRPGGLAG